MTDKKLLVCPFDCFEGTGEFVGDTRNKTFYKCKKCGERWSIENVTSNV